MRPPRDAESWRATVVAPVDAASVAVFRIAFGVAVVVNAALYAPVLAREYYMEPSFHFGYGALDLAPPPGQGIRLVYLAMAVAGAAVAAGWHARVAAAGVLVTNTYVFLLDSTYFQNHEYLLSLLALLLVVLPTDRRWSIAARRHPDRPTTVPRGVVWMLRFQVGVPYVYGGLAKLNGDWFRGEPLRMWLAARTDLEPLHTVLTTEAIVSSMAYGALLFDLAVVPALLHPRTRRPAFALAVCFHVTNAWLFGLFIFPWLMIAATTIFLPPDWPLRAATRIGGRGPELLPPRARAAAIAPVGADATSGAGVAGDAGRWALARRRTVLAAAGAWIAIQLLVPLRHHLIEGDPSWTEQAHRYSWHMRLRDKSSTVTFVVDDGERVVRVDPGDLLGAKQTARLGGDPERLATFARHLSGLHGGAAVRAETSVSLNGRPPQPIVDPTVDLSAVRYRSHRPNDWVLPLESPPDDVDVEVDG